MRPEVRPAVPRGLVICVIVMIPEVNQGRLACIKPIGPGLLGTGMGLIDMMGFP